MKIGFASSLCLLFIALKLLGIISWSWFRVISPLWGGFALLLIICTLAVFVAEVKR